MDLPQLLQTTPETLAAQQYRALKDHVINKLRTVINHIEKKEYSQIEKLLGESPAGDGHGCNNSYIDFSDTGCGTPENGCDIGDVLDRLRQLNSIAGQTEATPPPSKETYEIAKPARKAAGKPKSARSGR